MPSSAIKNTALSLGFRDPQIVQVRLSEGQGFRLSGSTSQHRFDLRFQLEQVQADRIVLGVDGDIGTVRLTNVGFVFRLKPNQAIPLSQLIADPGIPPNLYIAVISPEPKRFRPIAGGSIDLAFGEVRDTVPPPPPQK